MSEEESQKHIKELEQQVLILTQQLDFWVYRSMEGDAIFHWTTTREHHHATDWFGPDYEGILQSDGYKAYVNYCNAQRRRDKDVTRMACMAHIRRKFEEAGQRSAVIYTLLMSARNHGVDPQAYLRAVIDGLPGAKPDEIDALLPANWAAANRDVHPAIKSNTPKVA